MTEYDFRVLEPDEYRTANNVFLGSIHIAPAKDEHWQRTVKSYEPGRSLGAFAGDVLVGCATTFASGLSIPGGAVLPMAMVSRVGVRADHTRRGVLTGLMRAQLTGLAEPIATLRASEAVIYRRFGYGVATRGRTVTVDRAKARTHPDAPTGGRVRLIGLDEAEQLLPEIYRRIGATQPGWVIRDGFWWGALRSHGAPDNVWGQPPLQFAVHSGPDGDDGFACYRVVRGGSSHGSALEVEDVMAGSTPAWAGLWRFLLSVDLVHEVRAPLRPLDEPLELLLVDNRAVTTTSIDDETWLRIVDVPAALAARSFGGAGSVVIEVRDPLLPANSGRYRIGDGPAHPVGEPAELVMDVSALATVYLGDLPPSALAATGRLHAIKDDAVAVADRLFAVPKSPWCGSYF